MGGRSGRKVQRRVPNRGRQASPPDAETALTNEQGHKRLNTLEQLLGQFLRTLVEPEILDKLIAGDTLPSTSQEHKAYFLIIARSHIERARAAIDHGDAGRATESSVIAATYIASILDRASQQRLHSQMGGRQTNYSAFWRFIKPIVELRLSTDQTDLEIADEVTERYLKDHAPDDSVPLKDTVRKRIGKWRKKKKIN